MKATATVARRRYECLRRIVDIGVVVATAPVAVVLLVATAAVIQVVAPGPVLFRQRRAGHRGREFVMMKLRTMHVAARSPGSGRGTSDGVERLTATDDARTTAVTRWIRRHRLDELPQLWHVLTGEMALIGPRPTPAGIARTMTALHPRWTHRLDVRPGLTGLAQVRLGYVDDLDGERRKLEHDLEYIERMSPLLDFAIIAATARTLVRGAGGR